MWTLVALVTPCVVYVVFFHKTETKRYAAEKEHHIEKREETAAAVELQGAVTEANV